MSVGIVGTEFWCCSDVSRSAFAFVRRGGGGKGLCGGEVMSSFVERCKDEADRGI